MAKKLNTLDVLMMIINWVCIVIGERLCDHLKKAEQTRKETEDQLALLLRKLNETGLVHVQLS